MAVVNFNEFFLSYSFHFIWQLGRSKSNRNFRQNAEREESESKSAGLKGNTVMCRELAQTSTLLDSDRRCNLIVFASSEVPKNNFMLTEVLLDSLETLISLKKKTRCPHKGTLQGFGRTVGQP